MAMKIESNPFFQIAEQFTQQAVHAGVLQQKCDSLFISTERNSTKETLLIRVCDLFNDVFDRKQEGEKMLISINTLNEIASPIFKAQAGMIMDSIYNSEKLTYFLRDKIFDAQWDKINEQFRNAIRELLEYRHIPTSENCEKVHISIANLAERATKFIGLAERCFTQSVDLDRFDKAGHRIKYLEKLIEYQKVGSFGNLCTRLNFACENPEVQSEIKAELQNEFHKFLEQQLPADLLDSLDDKIYELAPLPKESKGEYKLHRCDDLNRFRQALIEVISQDFEKHLKKQIPEDLFEDFYITLYQDAFGPMDMDPKDWVQSEFPSLYGLIGSAVDRVLKKRQNYISQETLKYVTDLSDFERQIPTQGFSYYSHDPQMQLIISLRNTIDTIGHQALSESGTVDKEMIKTLIKESLDIDLCNALYGQIYYIAEDRRANDPNWGEIHCADDLARLLQALDNLKDSIVYQ